MGFTADLQAKLTELAEIAYEKLNREFFINLPDRPPGGPPQNLPSYAAYEHDFNVLFNTETARFWQFAEGSPQICESMLKALGPGGEPLDPDQALEALGDMSGALSVAEHIRAVEKEFGPIATMISGWHGTVADFLAALQHQAGEEDEHGVIDRQVVYVAALGAVVAAVKATLERARQDALALIDATIEALKDYLDGQDNGSRDFLFRVVGAVASVMGAGPWVGVAISFADYFTGLQSAAPEDPGEVSVTVEGDSVAGIISSMGQAITQLETRIADQDDALARGVRNALDRIDGSVLDDFKLVLDELATDPAGYSRPDGGNLALVYEDAYKAGAVYFSAAAAHYDRAAARLELLTLGVENAFGQWFPNLSGQVPYRAAWGELVTTLQTVLRDSRDYLHRSGQTLCDVVVDLAALDGVNADRLQAAAQELESDPDITTMEELAERAEAQTTGPIRGGMPM